MTDYGYAYNEGYRDGSKAEREKHKIVLEAMQAKIDSLMLEYCPDEMTAEQIKVWGESQRGAK